MTLDFRRLGDASEVSGLTLSALDAAECWAGGLAPEEALTRSISRSTASYALVAGGDVLCVWGYRIRTVLAGGVDMWLLGTPGVQENGRAFARESRAVCAAMLAQFGLIRCIVWEGHAPALRWLQWLGFETQEAIGPFVIMEKRFAWGS